ncbi:MAG TPA: right-handed parallel beta-helix repeat-containing protein [Phycisphaerae bacterium]|nr:right-handed parallel beta-helix repeat-containing protein [Phycisphaerae bacterium]
MQAGPIAVWHFDKSEGLLIPNAVSNGRPLQVHGAVGCAGRFSRGLAFRHRFDYARGPAVGALEAGAMSMGLRMDRPGRNTTVFSLQEQLKIVVQPEPGQGLSASLGSVRLICDQTLEPGRWHHVAVSFGPGGASLYLDGRVVANDPKATQGLPLGRGHEQYMLIGGLQPHFVPCAVDELAVFDSTLNDEQVRQLAAGPIAPADGKAVPCPPTAVCASRFIDENSPTCGLQQAIDSLGPPGGTVTIPAGRYVLRRGIELSASVTLIGEGGRAIFVAPPAYASRLTGDVGEGSDAVTVADASGFAVGDEIMVTSHTQRGWNSTHAILAGIEGNILRLSRPLWNDYKAADEALAVHWFPMVRAFMQHEIYLTDLTIEGTPDRLALRPDFTASAIHLVRCCDSQIARCRVIGWPHDGISVQMGGRVSVTDCHVRDCCGHGFHPGTGTRQTLWSSNIAAHNGTDGLYFCARVRDSICANSVLADNGRHGVGGLGGGEDRRNLVSANQCVGNAGAGIEMDGGGSNTVVNNICRANSRAKPGKWPGILLTKTRLNVVAGNQCLESPDCRHQSLGIEEKDDAQDNIIRDNVCFGCDVKLDGKNTLADRNIAQPTAKLPAKPDTKTRR